MRHCYTWLGQLIVKHSQISERKPCSIRLTAPKCPLAKSWGFPPLPPHMSIHRACWMMDPTQGRTVVAKAALAWALFLTSFPLAPEALSMVVLLSVEQTYFCTGGKACELFFFGLGFSQVFVVCVQWPSGVTNLEENDPGQNLHPARP